MKQAFGLGSRDGIGDILEKTTKFAAYFTDKQREEMERCRKLEGSRSTTEYVRNAVEFYNSYVSNNDAGLFLPRSIKSYLDGRLGQLEDRVSGLLFKQAVEQDMISGIIADSFQFTEDDLRRRRANSVRNVKQTNGRISFEKRVRESWVEDDDQCQV